MHKSNSKSAVGALLILFFLTSTTYSALANSVSVFQISANLTKDTIPAKDTLPKRGFIRNNQAAPAGIQDVNARDTTVPQVDTFNLKLSKDTLSGPVDYEAEDSVVVLIDEKKIILYGKTTTKYEDVTLRAPKVEIDQRTSVVTAFNEKDSAGKVLARARFEQGANQFESDTIQFNFKTQKGITRNTITQQDEFFIHGEVIKKVSPTTVFIKEGRFTTCNLDEPHFHFSSKRMKVVNNKVAVTGYVQLEFEDVPIPKPIGLPFGIFPLERGRHSGMMAPTFTTNEEYGLGLEGLGYYKVFSEYLDVLLQGNIYSYGGWSVMAMPTYRKRYRYQGGFRLSVQSTKMLGQSPEFEKSRQFNIGWTHTMDQRARPGVNFSATVNAGSTQYNKYVANDPNLNFQNQLYSSISYSKTWKDRPFNLTLNANHNQNSQTRLVNVTLPDASFTMNTIYPLSPKESIGTPKWYEKLGLGYRGSFRNQLYFYDSAFTPRRVLDTLQWGAIHSVPISLSLPPLGPLMVSPNISFEEQWIMQKVYRTWNASLNKLDTTSDKGFFTTRNISMGISFNTALFGTLQFRNAKVAAIRHVMRPSFSMNYSPNLQKKNYYRTQVNTSGRVEEFSMFTNGGYSNREFGGIGFGLDNNLEMKTRTKGDSTVEMKKLRLIDGFGFNSSYNFLQDSLKLGDFSLYLRSTLFEKLNITANARLTPYQTDAIGQPINQFLLDSGRLGRITDASLSMSTQFTSKPRDPSKPPVTSRPTQIDPTLMAGGDQQMMMEYMRRNPGEFVDFNIPWDIGLDFHLSYTTQRRTDLSGYDKTLNSSLTFRNSFSLTPKWNFSTNGYFNFDEKKLEQFTMSINRDLHCWQMGINVTPIGRYSYFSITINPKSSMLQDLKVNRTRSFSNF